MKKTYLTELSDGRFVGVDAFTVESARASFLFFLDTLPTGLSFGDIEEKDPKEPITAIASGTSPGIFWITPDGADFLLDENGKPNDPRETGVFGFRAEK